MVEVFFQIALAANLIASTRNSNRTDITYLFYLPFCQLFVSGDRLHRRVSGEFLRSDQEFVWGHDLKSDLAKINAHYLTLPEAEREKGLMRLSLQPPQNTGSLVSRIRGRHGAGSARHNENLAERLSPEKNKELVDELLAFVKGETILPTMVNADDRETLSIERKIHRRRGSWWQVPKDLKDAPE